MRSAFVVSLARSGSTLLRYLIDSHPEIVSPPELNLSSLLQHLVDVWGHTDVALGVAEPRDRRTGPPLSDEVSRRARKPLDELMASCANAAGASMYCDKSLTTIDHLGTISRCFPESPLIFLYRYPLDMIASGLEASRWGFSAFGFAPYVNANPGNFVAGLANYWIDKVSRMLEFERSFTGPSARIYYELLCDDPATTLENLFDFLEVAPDPEVIERAFASDHGRGPGDYKIDYTGAISVDSVGRGSALPEHMGEHQVTRINELLAELDYPELGAAWHGDLAALIGLKNAKSKAEHPERIAQSIANMMSTPLSKKLAPAHQAALPLEILVVRAGSIEPQRVLINSESSAIVLNGDDPESELKPPRVRCRGDVLLRVASGEVPFGNAVRDGDIRIETEDADEDGAEERPRPHLVLAALSALVRAHA